MTEDDKIILEILFVGTIIGLVLGLFIGSFLTPRVLKTHYPQSDLFIKVIPDLEEWNTACLMACLIEKESGGNEKAVGKAGEIGILQFMPRTFYFFCVKKYGLPNRIWSAAIQKECAKKMLLDGFENHWMTLKFCK